MICWQPGAVLPPQILQGQPALHAPGDLVNFQMNSCMSYTIKGTKNRMKDTQNYATPCQFNRTENREAALCQGLDPGCACGQASDSAMRHFPGCGCQHRKPPFRRHRQTLLLSGKGFQREHRRTLPAMNRRL